jgi:hypothetical protein
MDPRRSLEGGIQLDVLTRVFVASGCRRGRVQVLGTDVVVAQAQRLLKGAPDGENPAIRGAFSWAVEESNLQP